MRIVATGMMKMPSQNTGDENNIWSMPTKMAATGIVGQKLLKQRWNGHNHNQKWQEIPHHTIDTTNLSFAENYRESIEI